MSCGAGANNDLIIGKDVSRWRWTHTRSEASIMIVSGSVAPHRCQYDGITYHFRVQLGALTTSGTRTAGFNVPICYDGLDAGRHVV